MEKIDAILYINLAYRTDRNAHILHEINKLCTDQSKIHRIDAIKNDIGILGCGLSHIKALEYALSNQWETVLILEDDFTFRVDDVNYINDKIMLLFENDFDVGLLSHNYLRCTDTNNDNVKKVIYSQTASSYIIKKNYIPVLLQNMHEGVHDMITNGKKSSNCIDIHWAILQPLHNWYTLYPAIGYQYGNYSDIENDFRSYDC